MMKKLLVFCFLIPSASSIATEIDEILDADAKAQISIFNTGGEVSVVGWSRNQVAVEGVLGSGVKELVFESDGKEVIIEVKIPRHNARNTSSDLLIKVPFGSSLDIGTVSADVTVADVQGRQQIETVSGDIDTAIFGSDVDVESVSGDIEVQGNNEKMRTRAESVSGDIDVQGLNGEIEVASVSGDIVLFNSMFEAVEIQAVTGDIVYHSGLYGKSRFEAETVNGDIDVKFSGKVSAHFNIETFNGDIRNCFGPEAQRTSEYAPGLELNFSEGEGNGRVVIQTLNGDLRLCRD